MAGPWLKVECSTPDKPHVLAITGAMGWDDPDLTLGKLFRMWRWFDQHTVDGNAIGVTSALLDRVVGVTGFIQAVADAGWLTISDEGICLAHFDEHNGDTAKNRAQTAKRVAEHKSNAKGNAEGNATTVTEIVPRGRGRSTSLRSVEAPPAHKCPSEVDPQVWADWLALRKAKKAPVTPTVVNSAYEEADKAGMTLDAFLRVWCARGSQGLQADWLKPDETRRGQSQPQKTVESDAAAKTSQALNARGGAAFAPPTPEQRAAMDAARNSVKRITA